MTNSNNANSAIPTARPDSGVLVFGVMTFVMGLGLALFGEFPTIGPIAFMLAMFGIGVWKKQVWGFCGVLGVAFVYRFVNLNGHHPIRMELNGGDLLFALLTIGFLASGFRFLELARFSRAFPDQSAMVATGVVAKHCPSLFRGRWLWVPVSVFASFQFLKLVAVDPERSRELWMTPVATRLTMIVFLLFLVWMVCRGLSWVSMRRRMNAGQANVLFRSIFAREFWRDHSAIERRRSRKRLSMERHR